MNVYKSRNEDDCGKYIKITDLIEWMNESGKFDSTFIRVYGNDNRCTLKIEVPEEILEDEMYYIPTESKVIV